MNRIQFSGVLRMKRAFPIFVPVPDDRKRYSVMRFNDNLNVDFTTWQEKKVMMKREDNRSNMATSVTQQDYGAGSVYGRAAREEARRKRYGRQVRNYHKDRQPWLLNIKDIEHFDVKEKKYRSIVDSTGDHADYWVFVKEGDCFVATKVTDWHTFMPRIQHNVLDIDQAEQQFMLRSKVMNQFALKVQMRQQAKDSDERSGKASLVRRLTSFFTNEMSSFFSPLIVGCCRSSRTRMSLRLMKMMRRRRRRRRRMVALMRSRMAVRNGKGSKNEMLA